jgi:nucleoside-diphosphate kinase
MLTIILFKPDCVRRGLVGECLARFERRGFHITALRVFDPNAPDDRLRQRLREHYSEHVDRPFFPALLEMMTEGPLVACLLEGDNVVAEARRIIGPYDEPIPGTIRGDFATSRLFNVIHASYGPAAAAHELITWFPPELDGLGRKS